MTPGIELKTWRAICAIAFYEIVYYYPYMTSIVGVLVIQYNYN